MTTQFITNEKGERTSVIIPISEYEDLIHQHHLHLDLTDEYKAMMDKMLAAEKSGQAKYITTDHIKDRFMRK